MNLLILFFVNYLIGSFSSAIILSRCLGFTDPRTKGSGNAGATNVSRIAGKPIALLVFLMDFAKGLLPMMCLTHIHAPPSSQAVAAFSVVVGHIFPIYHRFKGGKGVATVIGVFVGYQPTMIAVIVVLWGMVALLTRYVSLASIVTICLAPWVIGFLFSPAWQLLGGLILCSLMVVIAHQQNLLRLWHGGEPRIC